MKTNLKRTLSLFLALALICGTLLVPAGAVVDNEDATAEVAGRVAASELYKLGLFQGVGKLADGSPDFDLNSPATRAQATVMLTRLLGAEAEAKARHYSHPFTDAGWAGDYIGYAYTNKITTGMSKTTFGSDELVTAAQFVTLVLRALGHTEVDWQSPWDLAKEVGLSYSARDAFTRGKMALICYSALSCEISGTGRTLRQKLSADGVLKNTGFTPGPIPPVVDKRFSVTSGKEALEKLELATNARMASVTLVVSEDLLEECLAAVEVTADFPECRGYNVSYSSKTVFVDPIYTDAAEIMGFLDGRRAVFSENNAQTLAAAQQIHASIVTPGMSEYDQVKAIHDYLVHHITYDGGSDDRACSAAGALVDGRAVCDGYAAAFDLMCYLSGIECVRVTGWANGRHAWNKVKVDGNWYNVDVTWDDPVSYRPMLVYDYFLISDSAISRDHRQNDGINWPSAPTDWK